MEGVKGNFEGPRKPSRTKTGRSIVFRRMAGNVEAFDRRKSSRRARSTSVGVGLRNTFVMRKSFCSYFSEFVLIVDIVGLL